MINNDDFFINLIKSEHDEHAEYVMIQRYKKLSRNFAKEMYKQYKQPGIMEDDFYSLALENYFRCLKRYQVGKNSFYPYWRRISHNACLKYVISIAKFNQPNSISLDSPINNSRRDSMTYADVIGNDDINIIGEVNKQTLVHSIRENDEIGLTFEEKKVIAAVANFLSFEEIAIKLNKTESHVRYVFRSAKTKLAKLKDTNN